MRRRGLTLLVVALSCTACGTTIGQQPKEGYGGHRKDRAGVLARLPRLESFSVSEAPSIDGLANDTVWNRARKLEVMARVVWPESKDLGVPAVIKSVHTGTKIYFLVRWKDGTKDDISYKPWIWNAKKKAYEVGPHREDMFAFGCAVWLQARGTFPRGFAVSGSPPALLPL
jgi:hypothetical protein